MNDSQINDALFRHAFITAMIIGTLCRFFVLRVEDKQYPSRPQDYIEQIIIAALAASLGAVALPALIDKEFSALTFLAVGIQQFQGLSQQEKITLENIDSDEIVSKGEGYINEIATTYEVRSYISLFSALLSSCLLYTSLINLDFADVTSVMKDKGLAHMGIGTASGENRAIEAAKEAIQSPLLETSIRGAKGVLLNVAGGPNLTLFEANAASSLVTESCDPEANIIFGTSIREDLGEDITITVIATGFESNPSQGFEQSFKNRGTNRPSEIVTKKPVVEEVPIAKEEKVEEKIQEKVEPKKTIHDIDDDLPPIPVFLRRNRK